MKKMEDGYSLDGLQNKQPTIYTVYTYSGMLTSYYATTQRNAEDMITQLCAVYETPTNKCRIYMRKPGEKRPGTIIHGKKYSCDK